MDSTGGCSPVGEKDTGERPAIPAPAAEIERTVVCVDPGFTVTPDPHARELKLTKRVIGVPGDTVVGRDERFFVNGRKADDIRTDPFPATHLGPKQYFVMGDNRSESQDSRAFGPVPRAAIFGRVLLIYWPLGRFGTPGSNKKLVPPGEVAC